MKNKKALKNESIKNNSSIIIPKELQNLKCFVCFDKRKLPINPETGYSTNITSNHWDYKAAELGYNKFKHIVGIGIILGKTSAGTLCGLDIDDCVNEKNEIAFEAKRIIQKLDTYTEISPSGKGLHCLFFASKPGSKCKSSDLKWCKALEIYDKDRYFTFTGNNITNKSIKYRQSECNRIYKTFFYFENISNIKLIHENISSINDNKDQEKLDIAIKYNIKLSKIWNGYRPTGDESRNDLSFMSLLMFWSNYNINLSIKAFKMSPYTEMKDAAHKKKINRKDYLLRTAQKCLENGGSYGKL
jgi:putative DNA primase/helicase